MSAARLRVGGTVLAAVLILIGWAVLTAPRHPIAVIRVVDGAGKPVEGAVIVPDGMRTKPGPYVSGHYGWMRGTNGPPALAVRTDRDGVALVSYPKYVFERIETGQISFSVNHRGFVPDRPFRVVTTVPPAGAPLREWLNYLIERVKMRALVAQTLPVVLNAGATVRLTATTTGSGPADRLFALFSNVAPGDENFWTNPASGVLLSQQVPSGTHLAQLVRLDGDGIPSFSEVVPVTAVIGTPSEVQLELRRGLVVSGRLDLSIRHPIRHGRVIAQVTPLHTQARDQPPQWHAWTEAREDGTFRLASLPPGFLEISAICDGFISTNGFGQSPRHPQTRELGPGDLDLVIGMEPTARLEVTVLDPRGKPVPNARVATWPNIQYGFWSSTIFGDCYNTADFLLKTVTRENWRRAMPPDFEGTSDSDGLAVVPNVPVEVQQFAVEHGAFQLPAIDTGIGEKRRDATLTLVRGKTNRVTVRLEPRTASQISHY